MKYKGYTASVEYDDAANVLFGVVLGLRDVVTFESDSVDTLQREFERSVDDYLALCAQRCEPPDRAYSGRFVVRIDPSLHRQIVEAADARNVSLNVFVSDALLGSSRTAEATRSPESTLSVEDFAGHTPGPWESDGEVGGWDNGHNPACRVAYWSQRFPDHGGGITSPIAMCLTQNVGDAQAVANARLIAAAPLLLDEVQKLRAELHSLRSASLSGEPR